jgi:hypothetical protein
MAGLKDDAQWIVLMGFVVSFSLFFIAIVLNQSTVIGQTTAEAVLEFPKNDIRGVRDVIIQSEFLTVNNVRDVNNITKVHNDIRTLSLSRRDSVVNLSSTLPTTDNPYTTVDIHYNNGVTVYNEIWRSK